MSIPSILLVEDEQKISQFIQLELQREGYKVKIAQDGEQALDYFYHSDWNLILLDWMLPKLDGLEVCRRIRKTSDVPIIMISAEDYIGNVIAGLDTGADDYITKPFEIEELLARIRAALRRPYQKAHGVQQIADLMLDVRGRMVTRAGENIELTQREFELLQYLMEHKGKVASREEILSSVWGYDFVGETNVVDVYIRYLRNKLDRGYPLKLIHTVHGVGYVLRTSQ